MVTLDHINLSVENLSDSLQWYDQTFGFKPVEKGKHKEMPYAIIRNEDSMICMYEIPGKQSPDKNSNHKVYHFGLRVADPELWEQHLAKQKIIPHLVWDYPNSKSWYLHDPTGHEIEVSYWNENTIKF